MVLQRAASQPFVMVSLNLLSESLSTFRWWDFVPSNTAGPLNE